MKFDSMVDPTPQGIGPSVDRAVAAGRSGAWVIETAHDPFLLLSAAAARSPDIQLGTAVAVAFARTPMLCALAGNDLQIATNGNFVLGLGTQVKPHVERRYSMPWVKPVGRMREFIHAIHAIWDSWELGTPLNFAGDYYTHTLMTPTFSPGPNGIGRPPIYMGAMGPAMTELAGEVADGLVVHRLMSERYLREVTIPCIERGIARRTRPLTQPFQLAYPPFVAAADSEEETAVQLDAIRSQIAFYASTPSYRPVLEMHGYEKLGETLNGLSRRQEWASMTATIPDEMIDTFAVISRPSDLQTDLARRFDGLVHRIILHPPL